MSSSNTNYLRNILVGAALVFGVLEFCFYLSGILFHLFVEGPDSIDFKAINPSLMPFPQALWPTIFDYIRHCLLNFKLYSLGLKIKLAISSTLPIIVLMIILWNLRERIIECQLLKKKRISVRRFKMGFRKEYKKSWIKKQKGTPPWKG